MHHLLATLGDGRMGYTQLGGYVLAPESLYIEHLQDDAVLAVSAIIEIADVLYRLIKIVLKLVVGYVKTASCGFPAEPRNFRSDALLPPPSVYPAAGTGNHSPSRF